MGSFRTTLDELPHDVIEETINRAVVSTSIKQEKWKNKTKPANFKIL